MGVCRPPGLQRKHACPRSWSGLAARFYWGTTALPQRVWACDEDQLWGYLLLSLAADPSWRHRPEVTSGEARSWHWARARLALPGFLRPFAGMGAMAKACTR